MKIRPAFTMIELIFVVVIMGIISKFGVEFMFQAYNSFIFAKVNNTLQSNSTSALEFISGRLQYRIKDSVIARDSNTTFTAISNIDTSKEYTVLEWIQTDIDGYRSTTTPNWSGIIDLDHADADKDTLISPETNTTEVSDLIKILSNDTSKDINSSAIYFIGSNSNIDGFGWGGAINDQSKVMHPIGATSSAVNILKPRGGDFSGIDVYEYYKLAWTANAVAIESVDDTKHIFKLEFYYNYQPWNGDTYLDGSHFTIMENISAFQFTSIGSIMKIQVCAKTTLVEEYALCKEKTVL